MSIHTAQSNPIIAAYIAQIAAADTRTAQEVARAAERTFEIQSAADAGRASRAFGFSRYIGEDHDGRNPESRGSDNYGERFSIRTTGASGSMSPDDPDGFTTNRAIRSAYDRGYSDPTGDRAVQNINGSHYTYQGNGGIDYGPIA